MSTAFFVLLLAAGASDAQRAEELNREASAISQTGDYATALAKYLEAVELAPDNDLYVSNAGLASWGLGKLDEAAEWLGRAVELAAAQQAYDRVQRYHMQIAQLRYVQPDWANEKRMQKAAQPKTPEEQAGLQRFQQLYGQTIQLTQTGEARQALESARDLVAFCRETYGDGHLNTLASLGALGDALRAAGKAKEAAPVHQEALKGAKTLLGAGHPDTLVYMHSLAGDWMAADKLDMARPVFEKLVRLASKTLGNDHPITATYMLDLGRLYVKLGKKSQARTILKQAHHIKQRELGAAHPETLATQQALAEALVATGRKAKAADELLAGYAQGKRVLGQLHPTTDGLGEAALALLGELHRYDAMVPILRDMLVALRAQVGEQHQATIGVTTRLAQTLELRGEVKEAHELFARALAAGRAAKLEPRALSTLVNNLAMAERRAGNLYVAEPLFEESVALVSAELGPTHEETLQVRNNRALLMSDLGRYAQARREYEAILAARRESLEPDHPELLRSMHNLGMFYAKLGRLDDAHRLVHAALRGRTRAFGESHPDTLYSLHGLATLYYGAGDYERAQQAFERVVALRRKVLGDTHADTLISMSSLGQLYQDQGRLAKAAGVIREVYERRRRALGPDHPQTFDALNDLAIIYLDVGRQRQALQMFDEALAGTRKRLGPLHPETIKVMNNVAQAYYGAGEHAKAKKLQQETLALSREVSGPMQPESVLYLGNLALIVDRLGEDDEARRLYREALAAKRKVFGPLHPETMLTLFNLAGFHLRREQWEQAGKHLDQVYGLTSKFLLTVLWGADAQTRQAVVATHGVYDATVLSYWIQRGRARDVLDYAINRKGLLLDIAAQVNAINEAQRDPEIEKAAATLERLRRDLAGLVTRGVAAEDQQAVAALQAQIEQLEAQLGRAVGNARARRAIDVDGVIAAIPAGSVLVELVGYVDVDLRTIEPAALAAVAVVVDPRKPDKERVRLVDLGRSDAWIQDLEALPTAVGGSDDKAMRAVSRKLYDAIWAPLVPALGDADRVLLVPDGRMHLVPFSALVDADGRYLAETTRLTMLGSSRDLLRRRKRRARGKQGAPVIIAGPAFGGQQGKATQRLSRMTFSPLPGAEAEGREIAKIMSAGNLAPVLLVGGAARESALASVASPRILHLATHGFVSLEASGGRAASRGVKLGRLKTGIGQVAQKKKEELQDEEVSSWSVLDALVSTGVALSGANEPAPPGEEDGILTGLEALALDLDGTELVVLSACETGLGRLVTQGEGVYGLRRAFQEAGARSVVSTLWPIDDAATRAFMTGFYRHFLGGASASDAVRAAQLEFIANPAWKHPYYWAAFTAVEGR